MKGSRIESPGPSQGEIIRRPQRVASQTFATEATVFTAESRQFGNVLLRKDHGTELDLTPQERIDFIRACIKYAKLSGRIDILQAQLIKLGEPIRQMTDAHAGLIGIESDRLGVSLSDIPKVEISPKPEEVREATGSAFPQFGTEQVIATITVPEEEQPSGETISAERIEEFVRLALSFMGMSKETIATNLGVLKKMKVTDREALFAAVNSGLVPKSALGIKNSKSVEVKPLHPKTTRRAKKQEGMSSRVPKASNKLVDRELAEALYESLQESDERVDQLSPISD